MWLNYDFLIHWSHIDIKVAFKLFNLNGYFCHVNVLWWFNCILVSIGHPCFQILFSATFSLNPDLFYAQIYCNFVFILYPIFFLVFLYKIFTIIFQAWCNNFFGSLHFLYHHKIHLRNWNNFLKHLNKAEIQSINILFNFF